MRRYVGIALAWLGATVLSVFIASTAVAGIRDRVVDAPAALGPPTTTTTVAPVTTITSAASAATTTSTTTTAATTSVAPDVTVTTVAEAATSTTATSAPETTTTAAPPATTTTTTTTAAPAVRYKTYPLSAGTVTLEIGDGWIGVYSVSTNTGFHAETEKAGPGDSVKVEFESNEHKWVFTASLEDGQVVTDWHQDGGGDDDGHEGD